MKKLIIILAVMALLVVGLAVPASAVGVSADCGGSGLFSTTGYAENWQRHTKGSISADFNYFDYASKTKTWGWFSGTQYASVIGYNLVSASARCIQ
jgi:hypothetical protein